MSKSTNNINVSSVVSPDILKTISASTAIKTFGSQLKDEAKEKIISSPRGKKAQLQLEIVLLVDVLFPTEVIILIFFKFFKLLYFLLIFVLPKNGI